MSSERYHKTYPISWEQIHRDCKALAWRLVGVAKWERIIGIARGGLVPAAIIARELNIRLVDTVCVSSYTLRTQGDISILKEIEGDGEGWLIIDD
ncbi:MAG: phosphoribosyltransferase family protein, partial [Synergistaceae bacterium]|nr:phosphoribosyltransferase family protein [Synergistaceae bacterium]